MTAGFASIGRDHRSAALPRALKRSGRGWIWPVGLGALGLLAAITALWGLQNGERSEYYAAVALSMSESWSNWFFGSSDPFGTITLDKIPGSYWIPALFIRVFGFSTWSVNAPNALATVAASLVTAIAARRFVLPFGATAARVSGLLAGLLVAATPIVMAVGRSNQPESFFLLTLALTAWAGINAVQKRSFGWLLAAGAAIALGFQMYMLEAWAAWPALGVAWLVTARHGGAGAWWSRFWRLLVAGGASAALSLAWIVAVSLVPASDRPYIGGTYSNSPWEMVFGYNGLGRFAATSDSEDYRSFTPPYSGSAGVLRLFNEQVGGQIAWLIPAALVAAIALMVMRRGRAQTVWIGGWMLTMLTMFSVVAGMHQFYTAALSVPIAILVAAAWGRAQQLGWIWPRIALLAAASGMAIVLALRSPSYLPWAMPAQVVFALLTVVLLVRSRRRGKGRSTGWIALPAALAIALTPMAWAVDTISHPSSTNPVAGSGTTSGFGGGGAGNGGGPGGTGSGGPPTSDGAQSGRSPSGDGAEQSSGSSSGRPTTGSALSNGLNIGGGSGGVDSEVLAYVQEHRGDASILLATFGAQSAAAYITATDGDNVIPIGGFSGGDAAPSLDTFTSWVDSGQLRFVLISGLQRSSAGAFSTTSGQTETVPSQIKEWVTTNCTETEISGLYQCGATD